MNLRRNLVTAVAMTVVLTALLGVVYPLLMTALAQTLFPDKANGQLVDLNGRSVGSRLIAQPFVSDRYFWPRPSAAGAGYDGAASSGSNLGPTNQKLIDRIRADRARWAATNPGVAVPVELITTSASGLDPHLSPAGAHFQIARVARARGVAEDEIRAAVEHHTERRQLGFLGEPRVNVLELNLTLDQLDMPR